MNTLNMKTLNMLTKEERDEVYNYMTHDNDPTYNLTKSAEELLELSLILVQRINKGGKIPDSKIIEEIGDVKIRLKVLEKIFSSKLVEERVNKKLTMFQGYIRTERFKNI